LTISIDYGEIGILNLQVETFLTKLLFAHLSLGLEPWKNPLENLPV
jgi:hypothetical protein